MKDPSLSPTPPLEERILKLKEEEIRLLIRALKELSLKIQDIDEIFIHALPFEDLELFYKEYVEFVKALIFEFEKSHSDEKGLHELKLEKGILSDLTHNIKIILIKFFNQDKAIGAVVDNLYEKMR